MLLIKNVQLGLILEKEIYAYYKCLELHLKSRWNCRTKMVFETKDAKKVDGRQRKKEVCFSFSSSRIRRHGNHLYLQHLYSVSCIEKSVWTSVAQGVLLSKTGHNP